MPTLELTDMELATAAMGVRAMRRQALADAERQENPGTKAMFERSAKAAEALIQKIERARKGSAGGT